MARLSSLALRVVPWFLLPLAAGCGEAAPTEAVAAIRFDPCRPVGVALEVGARADQLVGARLAIAWWNATAGAQLSIAATGAAPPDAVLLRFQAAAAPSHGLFDPASGVVFVNEDLTGHPLAVTIAHELGHAFGLVHVADRPSVMRAGNLDIEPNPGDVAALTLTWGACAPDVGTAPAPTSTVTLRSHRSPLTAG